MGQLDGAKTVLGAFSVFSAGANFSSSVPRPACVIEYSRGRIFLEFSGQGFLPRRVPCWWEISHVVRLQKAPPLSWLGVCVVSHFPCVVSAATLHGLTCRCCSQPSILEVCVLVFPILDIFFRPEFSSISSCGWHALLSQRRLLTYLALCVMGREAQNTTSWDPRRALFSLLATWGLPELVHSFNWLLTV